MVRRKRSDAGSDEEPSEEITERYKEAIDSSADELVCPLTLELPVEPVTAEDGKVYEREAIESHFANKRQCDLKSPVTNEPMGRRLLPALQVKNAIEKLVTSGAIGGDKAVRWNEELDNRKEVAVLRKQAEEGDADAMYLLAWMYDRGEGVKEDPTLACMWHKKAAACGHVGGIAMVGWHLIYGFGVDKNSHLGMMFLGRAENAGSDVAAYILGVWLCEGSHGLPGDPVEGKKLLRKVANGTCEVQHLGDPALETARKMLRDMEVPAVIPPEAS